MKRTNRQIRLSIVLILSLFIVFFVGREYDSQAGINRFVLTTNGFTSFRRGLDISGGSKLVYRIDYNKYDGVYTNATELQMIKQQAEDIILRNMDRRISSLGVSDYRSYIQEMNNDRYLVIEIGGISDLDEAKAIIGRTVELEFKLMNEQEASAESIEERRRLASNIYNQVSQNPGQFAQFTENRNSEDIYYNRFNSVPITQLPNIYQNNANLLNSLEKGELSPFLEGIYLDMNQGGDMMENNNLEGFAFFRILEVESRENLRVSRDNIIQTAIDMDKNYELVFGRDVEIGTGEYRYNPGNRTLIYNQEEIAPGQYAYDARIIAISKENTFGMSTEEREIEEARISAIRENVTNNISNPSYNFNEGLDFVEVYNDRIGEDSLMEVIPGFTHSNEQIVTYPGLDADYVLYKRSTKTPQENLFSSLIVRNISEAEWEFFEENMRTTTLYTIEDVFVQNKQSWIPAIDPGTNRALDGAFFRMASVSSSQLGRPVVLIDFDDNGRAMFCRITERIIGQQLAIFVGGQLITAPVIQDRICAGTAQIDGQFDGAGARQLAESLNEGALPAALILSQEERISPTLGQNALVGSLWAGVVGIILIVIFIAYMYGSRKAFVSIVTLLSFIVILLAIVKIIDYAMSLSAIAAIILSIGMGVDANILIYERIREELKNGRTIGSAIDTGYNRSRSGIKDGNLSTGLIALLLFTLGVNIFKGFGSMMILNIIVILFLVVPMIHELLHIIFHRKTVYLKEDNHWLEIE